MEAKSDFLEEFTRDCGLREECVFPRLRVTHDYTQQSDVDVVLLTSYRVWLLELVTWTGRYRKDNREHWRKEELVEGTSSSSPPQKQDPSLGEKKTVVVTQVPNPLKVAKEKTAALKQLLESTLGPRSSSDFDYRVVLIHRDCEVEEECQDPKLVTYAQIPALKETLRTGWLQWIKEKLLPVYPVWLRGYTQLKHQLRELPSVDILQWRNGQRWYGQLLECPKVLYDRAMVAELTFTEKKAWLGSSYIMAQAVNREGGRKMFTQPFQLEMDSKLQFLCVDSEGAVTLKLAQVARVVLSRPT